MSKLVNADGVCIWYAREEIELTDVRPMLLHALELAPAHEGNA